jgi:uridine kinase
MKPYLIGVAGPSCAGKSYLAERIAKKLDATLLPLDSYYRELDHLRPAERMHYNFDAPEALDSELFLRQARQLHEGESIARPVYDFTAHMRSRETLEIAPRSFVVIEGLFALYWESLRKLLGTKVFVDLGEEICLERRIERDMRERGRSRESVLAQYQSTVVPMARQYVYPSRTHADIVVAGDGEIWREVDAVLRHVESRAGMSAED